MLSRTSPPRVDPPPLPGARGPLSAAVLAALRGEPPGAPTPPTPTPTATTSSSPSTAATSCTTAASPASPTTASGSPGCSRCAARSSACSSGPCARTSARRRTWRRHAELDALLVEPVDGAGAVVAPAPRRRAVAAARVRRPPLALPPQGGRPAGLGDRPAGRAREGRARHRRARRVRRGRPGPHARPPVRRHDGRARAVDRLRRTTSTPRPPRRWPRSTSCRCAACTAVCEERWWGSSPRWS